jgi:hypothetical protein
VTAPPVDQARADLELLLGEAQIGLSGVWVTGSAETVRDALEAALPDLVALYGSAAASLAADWYDESRDQARVDGRFQAIVADLPDLGATEALAGWGTGPLFQAEPDMEAARSQVEGGFQKIVGDMHRDTVIRSLSADPQAKGWIRQTTGKSCNFCVMIAAAALSTAPARRTSPATTTATALRSPPGASRSTSCPTCRRSGSASSPSATRTTRASASSCGPTRPPGPQRTGLPATGAPRMTEPSPATPETGTEQNQPEPEAQPKPTETVDFWKQKAREQEKRAKENATAAQRLAELEAANLTELEKAQKTANEALARLAEFEQTTLRQKVALSKGLPVELVDRLRGANEDELAADADALLALVSERKKNGNHVPREGATTTSGDSDERAVARALFAG